MNIEKEDVVLIAQELQVSNAEAELQLREANGNLEKCLRKMIEMV